MLSAADVPAYNRNCVRFIAELNCPELDLDRLGAIIKQEVALAVKLLRYLNSAGFGWRHEVTSIKHALRVLGERAARKWCSLMALTVLGEERPSQLVVSSLVRAQFADQVGMEGGPRSRGVDLFLTGMLSTLDVLIGRPMEEALSQIPVSQEIRDTLLGRTTTLSPTWATTRQQDNKATRRGVDIAWSPRRLVAHSHALPLAQATSFRYTSRSASLKHTNRTSSIAGR